MQGSRHARASIFVPRGPPRQGCIHLSTRLCLHAGSRPRWQQGMTVQERLRDVDNTPIRAPRLVAEEREGCILANPLALHQDSLGSLDERAAAERPLEALILGKAAKHDLDHVLPGRRIVVDDIGEYAELRRFSHEIVVGDRENCNHRAGRFLDDAVDQLEGVRNVVSYADERDIGLNTVREVSDVFTFDLAGDDFVTERADERCDDGEALLPLVCDQDAEMLCRGVHR